MIRGIWATVGLMCVVLGVVGLFLPFLPTVPFLLAAGFFFGKSSRRLHRWLLNHPVLGPPVHDWNTHGAISANAKRLATLSVAAALVMSLVMGFSMKVVVVQIVALTGVLVFVWTRPSS